MSKTCTIRSFVILLTLIVISAYIINQLFPRKKYSSQNSQPNLHFEDTALNLTDNQNALLLKFRHQVQTIIAEKRHLRFDSFLVKWLIQADFDVDKAENLLVENVKWQEVQKIAKIHDEDWSDMDFEYHLNQKDSNGRPVAIFNLGKWNIRKAVNSGKKDRLVRYVIKGMDEVSNLVYQIHETNPAVTQYLLIIQLEDFSFFRGICVHCMSVYLEVVKNYEHRYPMMGYQIMIINTPKLFSFVIDLIRPILSDRNRKTLFDFGGRDEWEPLMEKLGVNMKPNATTYLKTN